MQHLGIDLGTGSVKVLMINGNGESRSASSPYPVLSSKNGYAETPSQEWIRGLTLCLREIAPLDGNLSIGFSGQMHGVVPCAGGRAIHPAILWNDTRAASYLSKIDIRDKELCRRCMNQPSAGMALFSILWIKDHLPEVYDKTEVFLQPKDYLRYYLTGESRTDSSDAGATLLFDFTTSGWHKDLLNTLGIDRTKLPLICNSFDRTSAILPERAKETGLPRESELHIGAADAACALLGNGISHEGIIQLSIGTGAQAIEFCNELPVYSPVLNSYPAAGKGYYRMSAHLNGGSFLEWLRGILGFQWDSLYEELASLPLSHWLDDMEGLIFHPYLNGERSPLMNPNLNACLNGLKPQHNRNHIILSAMLGTLFAIRLGLEELGDSTLLATGGSFNYPWWSELSAQVLNRPLVLSERLNASAWGAALIGAGENSNFYKEFHHPSSGKTVEPVNENRVILDEMYNNFCRRLFD